MYQRFFSAIDTYLNSVSSPGQSVLVWQRMGHPRWQENIQGSHLLFEHASPFLIKLSMYVRIYNLENEHKSCDKWNM